MKYFLYFLSITLILACALITHLVFSPTTCNTFEQKVKYDFYRFELAIQDFNKYHNSYPSYLKELAPEFIGKIRKDPWGNPYYYSINKSSLVIESYGADGVLGGINAAKDIRISISL